MPARARGSNRAEPAADARGGADTLAHAHRFDARRIHERRG